MNLEEFAAFAKVPEPKVITSFIRENNVAIGHMLRAAKRMNSLRQAFTSLSTSIYCAFIKVFQFYENDHGALETILSAWTLSVEGFLRKAEKIDESRPWYSCAMLRSFPDIQVDPYVCTTSLIVATIVKHRTELDYKELERHFSKDWIVLTAIQMKHPSDSIVDAAISQEPPIVSLDGIKTHIFLYCPDLSRLSDIDAVFRTKLYEQVDRLSFIQRIPIDKRLLPFVKDFYKEWLDRFPAETLRKLVDFAEACASLSASEFMKKAFGEFLWDPYAEKSASAQEQLIVPAIRGISHLAQDSCELALLLIPFIGDPFGAKIRWNAACALTKHKFDGLVGDRVCREACAAFVQTENFKVKTMLVRLIIKTIGPRTLRFAQKLNVAAEPDDHEYHQHYEALVAELASLHSAIKEFGS